MSEKNTRYTSVNGSWPVGELPTLTGPEAITAAKRLYRFGMKRKFTGKVKLTSGKRYTWIRRGTMYVNPEGHFFGGWRDLVHDLSHLIHRKQFPNHKPHDGRGTHAFLEKTMIEYVVNSGWLDGKLKKTPKSKTDLKETRANNLAARIAKWEAKAKRAANALKKLRPKLARGLRKTINIRCNSR